MLSRRTFLTIAAAPTLALGLGRRAFAGKRVEILMRGDALGADVWFDPIGLLVRPGETIIWRNDDPGNSHTTTAYHPDNRGHALRIPARAASWNSNYLLPSEAFTVEFTVPGVYDYFCIPHEIAGMVGRIVVAQSGTPTPIASPDDGSVEAARHALPAVEEIMRLGIVRRKNAPDGGHRAMHK